MTHRAIIWDMNGVLVDDESHQWDAFRWVLNGLGVYPADEEFERYCGVTEQECFAIALGLDPSDPAISDCMRSRRERYVEVLRGVVPLYPGARDVVEHVAALGATQGIASGACREEVLACVNLLGPHRFAALVAAEDVENGKPNPEGYLRAASILGVAPEQCIVIEDAAHGIEAALAAGMTCYALAHSLPAERLHRAHRVFTDLPGLLASGMLGK